MKKLFGLCFALMLLCAVFSGCDGLGKASVSAEVKAEMDKIWLSQKGEKLPWDGESGYYGTYDGAVVYIDVGLLGAITEKVVADQKFVWSSSFTIQVYKDGAFYDLETAYEKGLLTKENIGTIAKRHEEYRSAYRDALK